MNRLLRAPFSLLGRLVLAGIGLASCAHPLPPAKPAPSLRGWPDAIDWRAAGREAAEVLSGYLKVDTCNPPGNETRGARYLAGVLQREKIPYEILEFTPGRGSLIARLKGSGAKKPLCLLSHIDVATAEAEHWPEGKGPLSGTIDDKGMIWGRGALDMKGMGVLELMTLVWLKRLGVPLERDVVLLAVADEEVGNRGMRFVVDRHWGKIRCSHLVNEGGLGLRNALFDGQTVFAISTAEKGVLWLRRRVKGEGGHGSVPRPEHTTAKLLDALQRIRARVPEPTYDPSLEEMFARVGEHRGGLSGFVLKRPILVRSLLRERLMGRPGTRAALIDTINITGLSTGEHQPNVVPSTATALLDCRLLPGSSPAKVVGELMRLTGFDPQISFERLTYAPALGSPRDDPLFEALARHCVAGRTDAVAGPVLSIGFTDSIFARQRGVHAYGLIPFEVTEEEANTMHAPNERVSVQNIERGLRILFSVVIEVAADLDRPKQVPGGPRRPPPFSPVTISQP
jgi:acetylornithine deacetylase/succinyl-diaminopimelate desuccinylase-like protein